MEQQKKQKCCRETSRDRFYNIKKGTTVDTPFFMDAASKIMAQLMGADKDIIMKKYHDKNVESEEMENYLKELAFVSIWGAEMLCHALSEEESGY